MATAKAPIMRKRQLAQALVEETGMKLKTATAVVEFVFDQVGMAMAKGTKVNIKDFGIFVKAQRKARMGRNPATGEPIKIKASTRPRFTPSKAMKESMASNKKYEPHYDEEALEALKPEPKATAKKASTKKTAKKTSAKKKTTTKKSTAKKTAKKSASKKKTTKKAAKKAAKKTAKKTSKKTSSKKTSRKKK